VRIGIAVDLRSDFELAPGEPPDRLEEYDDERTVAMLCGALAGAGHEPLLLGGGGRLVERLLADPPDVVFNVAEGRGGRSREAQVPALLELLGIPHTHSDATAMAISLDKAAAKAVLAAAAVPVPAHARFEPGDDELPANLRFPVVAKLLHEGSSMGLGAASLVTTTDEALRRCAELATAYDQPVLLEQFCPGPEFTVGVLGSGATAQVLAVMEVVPRNVVLGQFLYDLEVKRNYTEEVDYHVPPRRPDELVTCIGELAIASHRALGCVDVSRVDLRIDREGRPVVIEVNPLPGLLASSDLVIMAAAIGIGQGELIVRIFDNACARLGLT
jgi:D-alanine-D-alanine ligase